MGSRRVAVVTDSTAALPPALARDHEVTVVPLQVVLDGRPGDEGVDITATEVAVALAARRRPGVTTSRPSPRRLADAYRAAADAAAADCVVAVHLSHRLSGTVDAARLAAEDCAGLDVRVVDSRTVAMALGFAALEAADAARNGVEPDEVVRLARLTAARSRCLFYVDALDHLRRGGRMGAAQAVFGAALAVKPLLHLVDGEIALLERVRTTGRALTRLEDLAVAEAGAGEVDLAVHHLAVPERAEDLADRLRARVPAVRSLQVLEFGAVVGTHVGPGSVGVVVRHA